MITKASGFTSRQQTIANQVSCSGIGLHSGKQVNLLIKPAVAGAGICFYRSDINDHNNKIPALVKYVIDTNRGTSIGNADGVQISTVEHLLAALLTLGIDNACVYIYI